MAQVDERGMANTHIRALPSVCQAPDLLWVSFAPVALLYLSLKQPQRDVRECPYPRDTLGGGSQVTQSDQHCGNMVNGLTKAEGSVGA